MSFQKTWKSFFYSKNKGKK